MRFYTNVQMVGNKFLVRGYENGKSFMTTEEFMPTLFVKSTKNSKYKNQLNTYADAFLEMEYAVTHKIIVYINDNIDIEFIP